MNNPDPSKVFDVSKPQAGPTSRPLILGHRPMMNDPMVNRPAQPASTAPIAVAAPSAAASHEAKTIAVSPEFQSSVAQPQPLTAPAVEAPVSPAAFPVTPPQPSMADVTMAAPPAAAADLAAASATVSTMPTGSPIFHSLPVSHEPRMSGGRLRGLLIWLLVLIILAAVGAYSAIDAGLVSSSIKLPFHIFGPAN